MGPLQMAVRIIYKNIIHYNVRRLAPFNDSAYKF